MRPGDTEILGCFSVDLFAGAGFGKNVYRLSEKLASLAMIWRLIEELP